jgi:hypothetical protein
VEILGPGGIWISVLLGASWLAVVFTITYAYKVTFFQSISSLKPETPVAGEFDSKGRWYKY